MKTAWFIVAAGIALIIGVAITSASGGEAGGSRTRHSASARTDLRDAAGVKVGVVKLEQDGDAVSMKVRIDSGTPGFHALHVHTVGTCTAPFTSAGGHYNPHSATHGSHAGDLPSVLVDADGEADARFATDAFDLGGLFDTDGSAVVLHAGRDNFANIPTDRYDPDPDATTLATGDAGARVACGVIARSR